MRNITLGYDVYFRSLEGEVVQGQSSSNPNVSLLNTKIAEEVNFISVFEFSILPDSPLHVFIKPNITFCSVIDAETGEEVFEGTVIDVQKSMSNNEVEISYKAEDPTGHLRDSIQTDEEFKGNPRELLQKMINRHNEMTSPDPYKKFRIGRCEVDQQLAYADTANGGRVTTGILEAGDKVHLREGTRHIRAYYGGPALIINKSIIGKTLEVVSRRAVNGVTYYLLGSYYSGRFYNEGVISADDILETRVVSAPTPSEEGDSDLPPLPKATTMNVKTTNDGIFAPNTPVQIKASATTYYWDSWKSRPTTIASFVRNDPSLYIGIHNRGMYALYRSAGPVGWIDAKDLDFGTAGVSIPQRDKSNWYWKPRQMDVRLNNRTTYDEIMDNLVEPYGAELIVSRDPEDGELVVDIVYRQEIQTDITLTIEDIMDMKLNTNYQDLYSGIRPVGSRPPREEGEEYDSEEDPNIYINDVNSGKDYYIDNSLQQILGVKIKHETFDNVESPSDLKQKAVDWIEAQELDMTSVNLTYAQIEKINPNYKNKKLRQVVNIEVPLLGISNKLRVDRNEFTLDLTSLTGKLELGAKMEKLTTLLKRQ